MKVFWLNESLVLRGETQDEKKALAILFGALKPNGEDDATGNEEGNVPQGVKSTSMGS